MYVGRDLISIEARCAFLKAVKLRIYGFERVNASLSPPIKPRGLSVIIYLGDKIGSELK